MESFAAHQGGKLRSIRTFHDALLRYDCIDQVSRRDVEYWVECFDIRREPSGQLTFGGGIHYCLGAALARVELQEALPRLAAHMRGLTPAPRAWR